MPWWKPTSPLACSTLKRTSKSEALAKVSDHLTTMGGRPDVHPLGGTEGDMTGRKAYTKAGYSKMQGEIQ